ncbi:MAG TPA: PAS domain-containing protein [Planctomycetota bacterium]|nr:PAS domain-containing protein [Planctomycetota bacterium]
MLDAAALLDSLMDTLPDAVFFKDRQGRFVRVNRVLASWYGLKDPADAVGKSEADFYPQEFARATLESERTIHKTGVPILDQEEKISSPEGQSHWVSTSKMPIRDAQGAIVGILGLSRDIKGVKRAEKKARDSDALYQSLIECLPQCIFRKDLEGRYVYVNNRLCDLLGHRPEQFLGKTDFDVNPEPLATKYRRDDQWVMTRQKTFEAVEEVKAKRKRIRIRIYKTPVYDSSGHVVGVQGVFSPLTEPKAR